MKNVLGYSLIEVMVVLAILCVSIFILAEVSTQMNRAARFPEAQVNLGAISTVIREALKFQKTCDVALVGGVNSAGFDDNSILNGKPNIQIRIPGLLADGTPNDDVLAQSATVQQLNITSLRAVNSVQLSPGKFFSQIELNARVAATGVQLRPMIAGGLYYNTAGGAISACDSSTDDPTPLCEEMGCTWDLTKTPACQCNPIDLTCPPQQFITGIDSVGKPICTRLGAGPCAPGEYLKGVSLAKNFCAPISSGASGLAGVCGIQNGSTYPDATTANAAGPLCDLGTSSTAALAGAGPWSWTCSGVNGGSTTNCGANQGVAVPTCLGVPKPADPSPMPVWGGCTGSAVGGGPCKKIGSYKWGCDPTGWDWKEPYCECLL